MLPKICSGGYQNRIIATLPFLAFCWLLFAGALTDWVPLFVHVFPMFVGSNNFQQWMHFWFRILSANVRLLIFYSGGIPLDKRNEVFSGTQIGMDYLIHIIRMFKRHSVRKNTPDRFRYQINLLELRLTTEPFIQHNIPHSQKKNTTMCNVSPFLISVFFHFLPYTTICRQMYTTVHFISIRFNPK